MKALLLRAVGFLCLAVGGVGLFVPILPTTPFVLIAAGCFAASSPKLYKWLLATRHFGPFIENYRSGTGVPRRVKRDALLFLWGTLCVSAIVFRRPLVWGILCLVGAGVTAHILLLKTRPEETKQSQRENA